MGGDATRARRCAVGRVAVVALLLFFATGAVYGLVAVPEMSNGSDPLLIVPTSLSLLHDGDLDLSELGDAVDPTFYGVVFVGARPYNRYPIGTSLLILPVVWVADRLLPSGPTPMAHALAIAAVTAKVLAAASVALLFVLLAELTDGLPTALGLALVFGFATVHFPIHAGGLFTHNAVIPMLLVALLLVEWRDGRHAALAAAALAAAFVTRPTCAPLIVLVTAYVARHRPQALVRYGLLGGVLAATFVVWSSWTYGTVLPPYYIGYDHSGPYVMSASRFAEGLVGHIVSPNRGILVFTPVLVFAFWGMREAARSQAPHDEHPERVWDWRDLQALRGVAWR